MGYTDNIKLTVVTEHGCSTSSNSSSGAPLTTESGISYFKVLNTGQGLEPGDKGFGVLSDGTFMNNGTYTGNGVNDKDPASWDIIYSD